jgi:hypothetical protein
VADPRTESREQEPAAFPPIEPPEPRAPGGTRRDRYGNMSMASRAKPKPVPDRRPGHKVAPRYSTRAGVRGVQDVCSCGYEGIWRETRWPYSMEDAATDGDRHARGLR